MLQQRSSLPVCEVVLVTKRKGFGGGGIWRRVSSDALVGCMLRCGVAVVELCQRRPG
jgi:hypothetical protein